MAPIRLLTWHTQTFKSGHNHTHLDVPNDVICNPIIKEFDVCFSLISNDLDRLNEVQMGPKWIILPPPFAPPSLRFGNLGGFSAARASLQTRWCRPTWCHITESDACFWLNIWCVWLALACVWATVGQSPTEQDITRTCHPQLGRIKLLVQIASPWWPP